ncbi:hypothetical protein BDD12DRAFT_832710 [Trichophaea hybrida]|nr:hypothetical protein BDD12DRAFT_832710 [Trichophaea hybrida]
MTLLLTAHRGVMNTGFTFSRLKPATDLLIVLFVGVLTTGWTAVVTASGLLIGEKPCRKSVQKCLAREAFAPWLLQILFIFWIVAYLDARRNEEKRRVSDKPVGLWKLSTLRGPFDWDRCVSSTYRWTLCGVTGVVIVATSYGALREEIYTVGILNVVGLVLFAVSASGSNKYPTAPHQYFGDMLRVPLTTRHGEGTVYVLPSEGYGFDAVWSPKISWEHIQADKTTELALAARAAGEDRPTDILRRCWETTTPWIQHCTLTDRQVCHLAEWLYLVDDNPAVKQMRKIRCLRAAGTHLIGRELLYALCHAEYLVFVGRDRIPLELQQKSSMIRSSKGTGSQNLGNTPTIGFVGGLEGYREAVQYIYNIFDEPMDDSALEFSATPPAISYTLSLVPPTIEEYAKELWDLCILHAEGTVQALYMFTSVWGIEVGNTGGYHGIPLRTRSRQGDMVAWYVVWRQAWYSCIVSQLVTMSPIILSAFLAGALQ